MAKLCSVLTLVAAAMPKGRLVPIKTNIYSLGRERENFFHKISPGIQVSDLMSYISTENSLG